MQFSLFREVSSIALHFMTVNDPHMITQGNVPKLWCCWDRYAGTLYYLSLDMISERFFSSVRFFPFDLLAGGLGDLRKKHLLKRPGAKQVLV